MKKSIYLGVIADTVVSPYATLSFVLMAVTEWGPVISSYIDSVCVLLLVGCDNSEVALIFALLLLRIIAITIEEMAMLTISAIARELVDIMHTVLVLNDSLPSVSVAEIFTVIG